MKIVFDVDDTISTNHRKLTYDKCIPEKDVIQKINYLHDSLGYEIVLHTSRGMISCGGDIEKATAKNKSILEEWLQRNNVHYDELIFGKPIADLYVDDKAMNLTEFRDAEFGRLYGGGSKKEIHRIGRIVKKDLGTHEDTERFKDWIEDNSDTCKYPRVISYLYDTVYMDYVDGERLVDSFTKDDMMSLLETVDKFKSIPTKGFTLKPQIDVLEKNYSGDKEYDSIIDIAKQFLTKNESRIEKEKSYSHGDMTLGNIIKAKDGLYFLDSRYFRDSSTYLFDLAKLRMSLMDYEKLFGLSSASNSKYLGEFDHIISERGLSDLIYGLNLMYICRLFRYKPKEQRYIVANMARKIILENEELFR